MRTWKDAIQKVLDESQDAMTAQEIAEAISEQGLYQTKGRTPFKTISRDINQSVRYEGEKSPFGIVEPGLFISRSALNQKNQLQFDEPEISGDTFIAAYGVLWRREWVAWGRNRLDGTQSNRDQAVNFAEQSGVYVLYDRNKPIYVGMSAENSLMRRLKTHTRGRFDSRWDRFSWFGCRTPQDDGSLADTPNDFSSNHMIAAMESLLIELLEPPQNRKHGDRFSESEYNQVRDEEIEQAEVLSLISNILAKR